MSDTPEQHAWEVTIRLTCNQAAPAEVVRHYVSELLEIGSAAVGDGALEDTVHTLSGEQDVPEHTVEHVKQVE